VQPSMVGPAAQLRQRSGCRSGLMDEAGAPAASAEGIGSVWHHLGGAGGAFGEVGVSGAASPSESLSLTPSLSLCLSY
jgi:hypothetical protein